MKLFFLILFTISVKAFDACEIEQIIVVKEKLSAVEQLISREKNPADLKILAEIKRLVIQDDYLELSQYIKSVLEGR